MIISPERSGFTGTEPKGEISRPAHDDIDDIIADTEAYVSQDKSITPEQRGEENLDPRLPHNGYLIDRSGNRLKIGDSTLGPWEGGGYYRVSHSDGTSDSLNFRDLHDGLTSGEYRIESPDSIKK